MMFLLCEFPFARIYPLSKRLLRPRGSLFLVKWTGFGAVEIYVIRRIWLQKTEPWRLN
jgi:hypothetical protein